jgi:hypothetical protein
MLTSGLPDDAGITDDLTVDNDAVDDNASTDSTVIRTITLLPSVPDNSHDDFIIVTDNNRLDFPTSLQSIVVDLSCTPMEIPPDSATIADTDHIINTIKQRWEHADPVAPSTTIDSVVAQIDSGANATTTN